VCAEFNECKDSKKLMPSMELEKVQIASETKDEREGKDVNLGVKGTNSIGHAKEIDKEGCMMKLIEKL
jgi:hypothetical protein